MTGRRRLVLVFCAVLALLFLFLQVRSPSRPRESSAPAGTTKRSAGEGPSLVGTLRSEPSTFNRFTGTGFPTYLISLLTQARLVRINRATHAVEPSLADRWTRSDDGTRYEVHLRDVRFSDGHPFTSADVLFSLRAAYDKATASTLGDTLTVDGKPLSARALGPSVVEIVFPAPNPGLRLLDILPIYPAHLLEPALDAGTFARVWGPTTPLSSMAGLGPFVLASYEPGQRLVFSRNPHYWRTALPGAAPPTLERLTLEIVPDQNAELLRLQAGQVDLLQSELRPEDYLPIKREADAGRVRLLDVGRSLESPVLWFNLCPQGRGTRTWLGRDEFRRAVSHAVDRVDFVRAVYLGAAEPAWGLVPPANTEWFDASVPTEAFDPGRAAALLASLGLKDTNADHVLEDASGAPVRFTVLVQKGITAAEKGAAVLRERLAAVGVTADVVALDVGALIGRWQEGKYDAIYHQLSQTDTDPAGNLDLWLSSGGSHVWNPGQARPATDWERQIDDLMRRQARSLDEAERHRLFADVQRVFAEHRPALTFAVPHIYLATSARVRARSLSVQRPQLLWDAETLAVDDTPGIH